MRIFMMQTNEELITYFFNDYRQQKNDWQMSSAFIFNTLTNLTDNKAVSPAFMFHKRHPYDRYQPQGYKSNPTNMQVEELKALSGLEFSFILDGYEQTLNQKNQSTYYACHEMFNEGLSVNDKKINVYETRQMQTNTKFVEKFRNLFQQMQTVIQYMIGYYDYSLSVDYSILLQKWESVFPSLHMTCSKEVRELNKIIHSTREANTFFKTRYETFVDFLIKSNEFAEVFMTFNNPNNHLRSFSGFDEERNYNNFFGHRAMQENRPVMKMTDKFKDIYEKQEKLFTDFIEANKDILVSRETHANFNQANLIADYKKVLKICEILIEKTNIHMNCKHLKAVKFLDTYVDSHDEIIALTNFEEKFRDLNIVAIINNIKNSSITAGIIFNDHSIAIKKKGYEGFQYSPTSFVGADLIIDGYVDDVNYMLRKNPSMNKSVKVLLKNLRAKHVNNQQLLFNSLKGLKIGLKSYFDNENILKSHNFDMINELKTSRSFEEFDDKIHKVVRKHKIEQYAMSIVSNKYKNLYSEKTFSIMEELYDMGISTHILQDMIGKKMASIKNTRSLNSALKSLLSSLNGFEISNIKMKAKANNVKILFEEENYLVLEIDTFKQSKAMGSPSWCISRDDYHFKNYTDGGNIQVFAYDFSLTSKDNKSIVGVTFTRGMKVHAAHNKNDTELRDKATKEKLIKIVADAKGIVLKAAKSKVA